MRLYNLVSFKKDIMSFLIEPLQFFQTAACGFGN